MQIDRPEPASSYNQLTALASMGCCSASITVQCPHPTQTNPPCAPIGLKLDGFFVLSFAAAFSFDLWPSRSLLTGAGSSWRGSHHKSYRDARSLELGLIASFFVRGMHALVTKCRGTRDPLSPLSVTSSRMVCKKVGL
jgi:hypothetical protein